MKKNKNAAVIVLIALLLIAIVSLDIFIVFSMTREQTRTSGSYQLQSVSGALEAMLNDANNLTMEIAIEAREHLDNKAELESFLKGKKAGLSENDGAYNVYMAGTGWDIIPDLIDRDGYVGTERPWYIGAVRANGKPYVSSPYMDVLTKDICYTVSVMLGDRDSVLGIDYSLDTIQEYIKMIHSTESANAVIVTDEGIIAGATNVELVGRPLIDAIPEYSGIYSLSKNKQGVVSSRLKDGMLHENLFATKNGNGWHLIISENEWDLYQNSYIQLTLTILLSIILFTVIIVLYILASRSRRRAESALSARDEFISGISGELKAPISRILEISSRESSAAAGTEKDENDFARIREAGLRLNEKVGQIMSYKSLLRTEKSRRAHSGISLKRFGINNRFRTLILIIMTFVMMISVVSNVYMTYKWGTTKMQLESSDYKSKLDSWIDAQKSKLDMFCSFFSTNPDILDDYEGTVRLLNDITMQYPEISASYITNPAREHTVYMNNGWEPAPDAPVEERPWYIDLMKSREGWIVTAPYYDQPTGGYCVTIAETVLDSVTGEFVGNFGIDFYMDTLVNILGDSYSDTGYAFLVDNNGDIINHPYGKYQMTSDSRTNISDLSYPDVYDDSFSIELITDYDSAYRLLIATKSGNSEFSIYVTRNFFSIYGAMIVFDLICALAFLFCIILVHRTLGKLIAEQERTNLKMQDAVDEALAAGKAKNQFLAQMSHEIRTPINAVLGMNEMILRESKDSTINEYSANIKVAGRNLLSLINSILDFSKIEDGKMEIIPAKYDLASMVNNLVNSISERAKAKSLKFNVDVDPTLPALLFGDDVRISQVVMNLLTNAVKYTHEGSVTLMLKNAGRQGNIQKLYISVRDTGIGIKSEDMNKLFESFERIDEIRNRNIEGTGLGMSIVTKLLAMMNSRLKVDSTYGVGSDFSFTIDQEALSDETVGNYSERLVRTFEHREEDSMLYAEKARILVVDDNDMNLKVARNLLKLSGIKPDLASSGNECIELMRKNTYDIVFMDHMMPGMDGIVTLHKLKEENLIPEETRMIVLTANAVVGAKEKYLSEGFDDYLSKPIEIEMLQKKLETSLPSGLIEWRSHETEPAQPEQASAQPEQAPAQPEPAPAQPAESANRPPVTPEASAPVFDMAPSSSAPSETDEEVLEFGPTDSEGDILEFGPVYDDIKAELPASLSEEIKVKLESAGISVSEGLRFCGKEESFYIEMLDNYRDSFEEKSRQLSHFFEEENWSDYQILIHAIKSSSKTIGSESAFTLARSLEEASGEGNKAFISEHHNEFIELYRSLTEAIKKAIG
ncbi:MAG: response regulator [Lachnospiraceae bacterium]|nr:response regulator [Lachnospiraceae bacterium]